MTAEGMVAFFVSWELSPTHTNSKYLYQGQDKEMSGFPTGNPADNPGHWIKQTQLLAVSALLREGLSGKENLAT